MGKILANNELKIPGAKRLDRCSFDPVPYYLVVDEIFPLKTWLTRPFPGQFTGAQRVFNYCFSQSRRVIENTFGILVARWRILHNRIIASDENSESYILATLALHNYWRLTDNAMYKRQDFVDSSSNGTIRPGEWRQLVGSPKNFTIGSLPNVRGSRCRSDALEMRKAIQN